MLSQLNLLVNKLHRTGEKQGLATWMELGFCSQNF